MMISKKQRVKPDGISRAYLPFVLLAKSKYSSGFLYVFTTIDYHLSGCAAAIIVR